MSVEKHFALQIIFFISILVYLYFAYDCKDTLIMSNTGRKEIDERPIWLCPKKSKISRLTHIYNQKRKQQSMGIFDKFTVTHITHGLLFVWLLVKFNNNKKNLWIIYVALLLEIIWELSENTPFIIYRYRHAKVATYRNYIGDSIANIVSDILFTVFGIMIAWYLPSVYWLPLIILMEILTYFIVGDSLIKNIYHLFLRYI